jgi:hypothetical protein
VYFAVKAGLQYTVLPAELGAPGPNVRPVVAAQVPDLAGVTLRHLGGQFS